MNFKDIDFGPDDAKGDARLAEYFIRIPEYERVRQGKANFVIGRKGTGKTAICQMILEESRANANVFGVMLSFKNSPSAELFESQDKTFRAPNQYISLWKFLIVLELSKMLLKDESVESKTRDALRHFLQNNFGNVDIACLDAVSTLRRSEWKVGLDISELTSLPIPAAELGKGDLASSSQRIHFGRAASALLDLVLKIHSENEFFLLFDELDEDYRDDSRYFSLLISLLKAAYQIKQEVHTGLRVRPIVVLREDIYARLDDHDLNKLDDSTVYLRWASLPVQHSEFTLRDLVNERLRVSLGIKKGLDLWPTVVEEENWKGPGETAWSYLATRTMDRPRDIVKILKCCQSFETGKKLSPAAIDAARVDYSNWLAREVGNEIFRVLPDFRDAFGVLTHIGKSRFTLQDWRSEFGKNEKLTKGDKSAEEVLEILFDFSVIGMTKRDRWLFKFKTPQVTFDKGCSEFVTHYGMNSFLVLKHGEGRPRLSSGGGKTRR